MQASITSEAEVTVDQLVEESRRMYAESKRGADFAAGCRDHPQFAKSYPIVTKWIYIIKDFDDRTFRQWLESFIKKPLKSEDDYLESQADFVRRMYRRRNPRAPAAAIRGAFNEALRGLRDERDEFKRALDIASKRVEEYEREMGLKNRQELAAAIKKGIDPAKIDLVSDTAAGFSLDFDADGVDDADNTKSILDGILDD